MAFALAQRGVGDAILEQKIDKLLTVIRTEAGENVDSGPSEYGPLHESSWISADSSARFCAD